jgi:hypothetical protein
MLIRSYRITFALLIACILIAVGAWPSAGQSISKSGNANSTAKKATASRSRSEVQMSLQILESLRAFRDCWRDPYMIIAADDPQSENDSLYLRCGDQYSLRWAELQDAAAPALRSLNDRALTHQIHAAIETFKDLDSLNRLFNSRAYFMTRDVRVSDIFRIVGKYNVPYKGNHISKVKVYQAMMPLRRVPIDELAKLTSNAPVDTNPTLTSAQAADAADDLDWSFVTRQRQGYDWYLRRHPQGRHAAEARALIGRQGELRQEQEAQLAKLRNELTSITQDVIKAYVRGDKVSFERLLGSNFPSRGIYIARLRAQPNVVSFEIKNFDLRPSPIEPESYRAKMDVQYQGLSNQQSREYHNTITYQKSKGSWRITDWRSP